MGLKIISKNKKGFFFTIFTIVLLFLFLVSLGIYYSYDSKDSTQDRVKTLNEFVFSVEEDIPRKMYASGFRIIFLIEKYIVEKGVYISNFNNSFEEAFFNGTINQEEQELMQGVIFQDILESLNSSARKINAEVILEPIEVLAIHENPWEIKFSLTLNITVRDKSDLASWEKIKTFDSYISIIGFEDPLYLLNTNGLVTNKINQTPYENFVEGSDVVNLTGHLENSYYINSSLGPSFIDRLEGKTTASENGIESMVYLPKLSNSGISVLDKSCIDYIYFSSSNPVSYRVSGMPSWFKIDDAHLDVYNVSHLAY